MLILDKNLPQISVNIYTDQEQPKIEVLSFFIAFSALYQ